MKMKKIIILITLFISLTTQVLAEKRYVTDRILLGIHTEADETSKLIKSVPSGTELEVLDTEEGFVKIKLDDGTEGWVSSGFIMKDLRQEDTMFCRINMSKQHKHLIN
jgi:SH3 domain protein